MLRARTEIATCQKWWVAHAFCERCRELRGPPARLPRAWSVGTDETWHRGFAGAPAQVPSGVEFARPARERDAAQHGQPRECSGASARDADHAAEGEAAAATRRWNPRTGTEAASPDGLRSPALQTKPPVTASGCGVPTAPANSISAIAIQVPGAAHWLRGASVEPLVDPSGPDQVDRRRLAAARSRRHRRFTAPTSSAGSLCSPSATRNRVVSDGLVCPSSNFAMKVRFRSH
jgi:hypothetical protein